MKETPQQLEAGVVTLISLLSSLGCLNVIFLSRPLKYKNEKIEQKMKRDQLIVIMITA